MNDSHENAIHEYDSWGTRTSLSLVCERHGNAPVMRNVDNHKERLRNP